METRNEAKQYGVTVVQEAVTRETRFYWKALLVRKLTPAENGGRHSVFIDVNDENGMSCRGRPEIRIEWGWKDQRPDEQSPSKALEKPQGEPMANVDLFGKAVVWIKVESPGVPSDCVMGLTAAKDDEGPGATWGHHSYYILFQRVAVSQDTQPQPEPEPDKINGQITLQEIEKIISQRLSEVFELIMADLAKKGVRGG